MCVCGGACVMCVSAHCVCVGGGMFVYLCVGMMGCTCVGVGGNGVGGGMHVFAGWWSLCVPLLTCIFASVDDSVLC